MCVVTCHRIAAKMKAAATMANEKRDIHSNKWPASPGLAYILKCSFMNMQSITRAKNLFKNNEL
jgi:hypothetical protein